MEVEERKQLVTAEKSLNTDKSLYTLSKRLYDIVFSLVGLLLLSILFLIIAIIIKIDDPKGPVLFHQLRVGKNGEEFKMYKFRSMYSDAEKKLDELMKYNEVEGAMFKMKEDPRVTRVGKILRQYSIDELPQLFNVLVGNMSLVGPRPPLIREVRLYSVRDKKRLLVKPGITGLWQVSGRNALSFDEMVNLDLKYIEKCSIKQDFKILFKTFKVVITKSNAY